MIRVGCQANAWERRVRFGAGAESAALVDQALAETAAAGYVGTELPTRAVADLGRPGDLRALVARHGLTLIGLHLGGTFYDDAVYREKSLPALRAAAACAAAAGAEGMVVSGAPKRAPSPTPGVRGATLRKTTEEVRAQTRNLTELGRLYRDLGLRLWYHNHGHEFEYDREDLHSILDVDTGLLSLCFDMGNAARVVTLERLMETMEQLWDRIGYLHYRDIIGKRSPEALGDGDLDFDEIGRLARSRAFSGWAVAELGPGSSAADYARSPMEDARISCEVMRRTLGVPL
ncbi:MAG: TIM barrel protein [Chloroflexi bacterium]|nr:TIM barrel protein [Chloroflexota bacterium]